MNNLFSFLKYLFFGRKKIIVLALVTLFVINISFADKTDTIPKNYLSQDTAILNAELKSFKTLIFLKPDSVLNCVKQIEKRDRIVPATRRMVPRFL